MLLKPNKLLIVLLLTAFLVTSLGSMFGCVICDSGSLSDIHVASHLDDHSDKHTGVHAESAIDIHAMVSVHNQEISLDQHYRGSGDACVDSPLEFSDGILEGTADLKSLPGLKSFPDLKISPTCYELQAVEVSSLFVKNSFPNQTPRISQTILAHRTVVLLS